MTQAQHRESWLDGLRGLLLVVMALNHVDSPISLLTFQPLGYASAAEGFVLVSGLTAGLVYTRRRDTLGLRGLVRYASARALRIFTWHGVALGAVVALNVVAPGRVGLLPGLDLVDAPSWFEAARVLGSGLLLLYQPLLFDILPLYVVLVLAAPWVVEGIDRGAGAVVAVGSLALWFLAQWSPPSAWVYALGGWLPVWRSGLDVAAFQVLFVAGIFAGRRLARGLPLLPAGPRPLWWAAAGTVAAAGFLLRIVQRLSTGPLQWAALSAEEPGALSAVAAIATSESLFGRPTLAAGRLLNAVALAALLLLAQPFVAWIVSRRWLTLLGRHALPVFAWHVVLVYLLAPFTRPLRWQWHFAGPFSPPGCRHAGWAILLVAAITTVAVGSAWARGLMRRSSNEPYRRRGA